jgi:hypothetical protein
VAFILPLIADLTEAQYALFMLFQSVTVRHGDSALPALQDADVAEGASAAAATLETARKGIIYEHRAVSVPAQGLASEYARVVAEIVGQSGSHQARVERDAAEVLRRVEQGARNAATMLIGDEPTVYLRLLKRILRDRDIADQPGADMAGAAGPSGGLIIPP